MPTRRKNHCLRNSNARINRPTYRRTEEWTSVVGLFVLATIFFFLFITFAIFLYWIYLFVIGQLKELGPFLERVGILVRINK
uniref:Movement protein n=1 Tax=Caenorhabditis tropicalis TaxID=1561998 RepID=A0A1I7UPM5_9PELO